MYNAMEIDVVQTSTPAKIHSVTVRRPIKKPKSNRIAADEPHKAVDPKWVITQPPKVAPRACDRKKVAENSDIALPTASGAIFVART